MKCFLFYSVTEHSNSNLQRCLLLGLLMKCKIADHPRLPPVQSSRNLYFRDALARVCLPSGRESIITLSRNIASSALPIEVIIRSLTLTVNERLPRFRKSRKGSASIACRSRHLPLIRIFVCTGILLLLMSQKEAQLLGPPTMCKSFTLS